MKDRWECKERASDRAEDEGSNGLRAQTVWERKEEEGEKMGKCIKRH